MVIRLNEKSNTDMFSEYKSDNLFLLVGTNPLPNYVAAKLLSKKETLYYFVCTRETGEIADRLINVLKIPNGQWEKVSVDPSSTNDIYSTIHKISNGKKGLGLDYTSGTKSMSVHAYRAIYDSNVNSSDDQVFSYLDARSLKLLIDRKNCDLVSLPVGLSVQPSIEELMGLHGSELNKKGYTEKPFHPELGKFLLKVQIESLRTWCNQNLKNKQHKLLNEKKLKSIPLSPLKGLSDDLMGLDDCLDRCNTLGELAGCWNTSCESIAKWLDGVWLEHYTLDALQKIAEANNIHAAVLGLKTRGREFEIDIVALKGYQLIVLSCTTGYNKGIIKQKLFEAYIRGKQLGGDEAKIGLVCFADKNISDNIQKEIEEKWDIKGKFRVFGHEDLPNLSDHLQEWFKSFE